MVEQPEMTGTEIRRAILKEVESCVCRDRQNSYGDAEDNFSDIARLANVLLERKLKEALSPEDVAVFSMCIKLARMKTSPEHDDNLIDLAGYATCGLGIIRSRRIRNQATSESYTQGSPVCDQPG